MAKGAKKTNKYLLKCVICKKEFTSTKPHTQTCTSTRCRARRRYLLTQGIKVKRCVICGEPFTPTSKFHKYCSDECFDIHKRKDEFLDAHMVKDEGGRPLFNAELAKIKEEKERLGL